MPSPLIRAPGDGPTALWLTPGGRLANRCSELPCNPCGEPPPPSQWTRASLCACSSSSQGEAWIRSTELAALRAANPGQTCATGKLPDGSCWEVLAGAEVREFAEPGPPSSQRLTPHAMGGCCFCCPGCVKTPVLFPQQDGCDVAGRVLVSGDACCVAGEAIAIGGYHQVESFSNQDERCGPAGVGLTRLVQAWWTCGATGCTGVTRVRRWNVSSTLCPLDSDVVRDWARGVVDCTTPGIYLNEGGWNTLSAGFPIECGTCTPPGGSGFGEGGGQSGPSGASWNITTYQSKFPSGGCVRFRRSTGTMSRGPVAASACRGSCIAGVLAPGIPPLPGGGDSVGSASRGRIIVPGHSVGGVAMGNGADVAPYASGGCSGCNDGGY